MTAIPIQVARAVWMERQGLDEPEPRPWPIGGWLRSIGGAGPYLAMLARQPDLRRQDVDAAFESGELVVVPGARGCIWTVSAADGPLGVGVAEQQSRRRLERDLEKGGSSADEVLGLEAAIVGALATGAMSTREIADALPDGAVRSFGEVGKKTGLSTTLPPALRLLEFGGRIRRRLRGARLEGERYEWALASDAQASSVPTEPVEQAIELARRYFDWSGPAAFDDFVRWAGVNKGPAKQAVEALGLVEVSVEDFGPMLCLPDQLAEAVSGVPLPADHVRLLPTLDNLLTLRHRPGPLFATADHLEREVQTMGNRTTTVAECTWITQRPLLVAGRWAGVWEWDADEGEVVWAGFDPLPDAAETAAAAEAERVGRFVRDDLDGKAKTTSIDGAKAQRRRVALVRAMRG